MSVFMSRELRVSGAARCVSRVAPGRTNEAFDRLDCEESSESRRQGFQVDGTSVQHRGPVSAPGVLLSFWKGFRRLRPRLRQSGPEEMKAHPRPLVSTPPLTRFWMS